MLRNGSFDVKTAFPRGKAIRRTVKKCPSQEAKTNQIRISLDIVYGLADASRSWYLTFKTELEKMQAKPILLDQGLFPWYVNGYLTAVMVLFFDDVLQDGEESFKNSSRI